MNVGELRSLVELESKLLPGASVRLAVPCVLDDVEVTWVGAGKVIQVERQRVLVRPMGKHSELLGNVWVPRFNNPNWSLDEGLLPTIGVPGGRDPLKSPLAMA